MWQYHIVRLISKIVCLLPETIKKYLGKFLGEVVWLVTPRWRKNLAVDQVKKCLSFDDEKSLHIAKGSATKYGKMLVEFLSFPLLNKDNIKDVVSFCGDAKIRFDEMLAEKKGIVLGTAHFGNWEMLGASLALYGYPLVSVAQELKNKPIDRFVNEYRTMTGEHVTYKAGVLEMARMLGEGNFLGLLSDQDAGKYGVVVDFFGQPTSCPKGPAAMARLKNAPLVLLLLYGKEDGTYEIFLSERIAVSSTKDREQDIKDATQLLMKKLEAAIREKPEMWFWLHDRWKVTKKKGSTLD